MLCFTKISVVALVSALLSTAADARPHPARLTQRDFLCDTKDIHCCDQVMTGKDAGQALGGLLALPGSAIGNVGLGCTVSLGALDELDLG